MAAAAQASTDVLTRLAQSRGVANDVSRSDIGFGSDSNEVTVFRRHGEPVRFSRRPKAALAGDLLELFATALPAGVEGAGER